MSSSVSMRGHVGTIDHLIRRVWAEHLVRLLWAVHPPFDPLQEVGAVSFVSHCSLLISPLTRPWIRKTNRRSMDYY
jgi:hypothetical protein